MCLVSEYIRKESRFPLFVQGDSLEVLRRISDCCVTSPPYWQKRQYENGVMEGELKKKPMKEKR